MTAARPKVRGIAGVLLLAALLTVRVGADVSPGPGWSQVSQTVTFENLADFPQYDFWLFPTWLGSSAQRLEDGTATLTAKGAPQLVAVPKSLAASGPLADEFFVAPDRIRSEERFPGDGYVRDSEGYTVRATTYRIKAIEGDRILLALVRDDKTGGPPADPWQGAGLGPIEVGILLLGAGVAIGLLLRRGRG